MDETRLYETWETIAARRQAGGIAFNRDLDAYEALSYETIVEILRDPVSFSSRQITVHPLDPTLANLDPPVHAPLRRTLIGAFSAGAIEALTPAITRDADELVDSLPLPGVDFDIKRSYAIPLALHTIMRLLRIPDSERDVLREGTEAVEAIAAGVTVTAPLASALRRSDRYFEGLARERLAEALAGRLARDSRDPVASLVWSCLDKGIPEPSELGKNIAVMFHGGNGTTSTLIANAIAHLELNPEQKDKFLNDVRGMAPGVVEETLRFEASTHGLFRVVTCEKEIDGTALREGDRVFCRFGSGSRDPKAFPHPERFQIDRDWSKLPMHLGFSAGTHFCLGASLARTEASIALATLYGRLSGLRRSDHEDDLRFPGLIFRGWETLHLRYSHRTPAIR